MPKAQTRPKTSLKRGLLRAAGWNERTRSALETLIRNGSGKNLPVVLDFDNTIVCGDIADALVAVLAKSKQLTAESIPKVFCPPFRSAKGDEVTLESCGDITEYYEALLAGPTAHGSRDSAPHANGHVWAVQVLQGLSPLDVVNATRTAFEMSAFAKPFMIEVTPGKTSFLAPFVYEPMVELLAVLLRHGFDVWIVSASPVWSVRWMVLNALNPRLRERGIKRGLRADHIIGISTLLADESNRLYKDGLFVRENPGYAALDEKVLGSMWLTSTLQFPVSTFSGKVACILDAIGTRPYLCVGDGLGDHSMMAFSQNRLWIARLESPSYQEATLKLIRRTGKAGWMLQPVICTQGIGFVPTLRTVTSVFEKIPEKIRKSITMLSRSDFLGSK